MFNTELDLRKQIFITIDFFITISHTTHDQKICVWTDVCAIFIQRSLTGLYWLNSTSVHRCMKGFTQITVSIRACAKPFFKMKNFYTTKIKTKSRNFLIFIGLKQTWLNKYILIIIKFYISDIVWREGLISSKS